jgi:hypothetical protein
MKENESILDEETGLCFNLTNIDGNHGYYILGITIRTKNSDDGYTSEDDAKKAAHDRCKEIIAEDVKKTVYVYDQHFLGMLSALIKEFEHDGNIVVHIDSLQHVEDDAKTVIINPLSEVMIEHWGDIKRFITKNPQIKVILTSPDLYQAKIEQKLGKHDHVKIFDQEQFDINQDIFGDILEELYR